jgi:hypothetical protein
MPLICPKCMHEVPEPPPLIGDYDSLEIYKLDRKRWEFETGYGTKAYYKAKCRCVRCSSCWGLCQGGCVCNKGHFRPQIMKNWGQVTQEDLDALEKEVH